MRASFVLYLRALRDSAIVLFPSLGMPEKSRAFLLLRTGRKAGRQAGTQAGREAGEQASRQAGSQAGRQAGRQAGKKGPMGAQSKKP